MFLRGRPPRGVATLKAWTATKGWWWWGGQSLPHEYSLPVNHLVNWEQVHSSHRKIKQIQQHMFLPASEASQGHEKQELGREQTMR